MIITTKLIPFPPVPEMAGGGEKKSIVSWAYCVWIITDYHRGRLHKYASTIIQNIFECFVGGIPCPNENFGENCGKQLCGKKVGPPHLHLQRMGPIAP